MNKLSKVFIMSFGILVANNGYSNTSDWEVIDTNTESSKDGWEVISLETTSKQPVIIRDASAKNKYRTKLEKYTRRRQLKNAMYNLYDKIVKPLSNNLQQTLDNLINQSNDFIESISAPYKEIRYASALSYLKEANENFIDILKDFKKDIQEYNKSINIKLNNIHNNNKDNSKMEELVISEIVNKFEEYAITFDYILNNKINEEKTLGKINYLDERYGDTINNILELVNIPSNLSNEHMQDLIKGSNEFVNKMLETNNEIQNQFTRKNIENQLYKACISKTVINME